MSSCFTSCNAMSRPRWMVRQEVGVVTPRHKRCGPWRRSLPLDSLKARRFKMSSNPSSPCLRIEDQPLCFARLWMGLAWGRPSQGRGDVLPLPDRNPLILFVLRHCKSRVMNHVSTLGNELQHLTSHLEADPHNPQIYIQRGMVYFKL